MKGTLSIAVKHKYRKIMNILYAHLHLTSSSEFQARNYPINDGLHLIIPNFIAIS